MTGVTVTGRYMDMETAKATTGEKKMEVVIIERGAYGNKSDRFNIVKDGRVVAGGIHHKTPFSSVWAVTSGSEITRFSSKAAMMKALAA